MTCQAQLTILIGNRNSAAASGKVTTTSRTCANFQTDLCLVELHICLLATVTFGRFANSHFDPISYLLSPSTSHNLRNQPCPTERYVLSLRPVAISTTLCLARRLLCPSALYSPGRESVFSGKAGHVATMSNSRTLSSRTASSGALRPSEGGRATSAFRCTTRKPYPRSSYFHTS